MRMVTIQVYADSEQTAPEIATALIYRVTWRGADGGIVETAAAFGDAAWGMVRFHKPAPSPADWSPAGEAYFESRAQAVGYLHDCLRAA